MAIIFVVKKSITPPGPGGDTDSSDYARTFTMYGELDPTFNENSKIGTATLKFIGNDQKLTTPSSSTLNIGTVFTIDFWMRFDPYYVSTVSSNGGARIISNFVQSGESSYDGYEVGLNSSGQIFFTYYADTGHGVTPVTITATDASAVVTNGAWHHIAIQRGTVGESNALQLFVNGVLYASSTGAGTYVHNTVSTNPFTIGAQAVSDVSIVYPFLYGTIDELEIIDGVQKFNTAGFTPPTTANTSTANHLLLMHFDDDNPEPTIWYNISSDQYWFTNGVWDTDHWNSWNTVWSAQYGWNNNFRPEKLKTTGTVVGGTITVENNDQDWDIGSGSAASELIMDLTFETGGLEVLNNIKYMNGMVSYSANPLVFVDARPIDPEPS